MSNIYGRQIILPLTNKSGGQVIAGDVVVVDTTNNDAFTTSTAGAATLPVGIAQETIASNATGRVLLGGYAALVNVNASVTRGNYGKTHTVAKQATDGGAARVAGTFCIFLTAGATPDAYVYPVDLAGAALTNPMTTAGDLIVGGTSGTPARLAAVATGQVLLSAGTGTAPAWGVPPAHGARAIRSTNLSVGNNTLTKIAFTAEDHDTDSIHDNTTNNSRMTIPTIAGVSTGLWMVTAHGYTDQARADFQALVNNTTVIAFNRNSNDIGAPVISTTWVFTAADYVELLCRTTAGAGNILFDSGASPIFTVAFLGKVT